MAMTNCSGAGVRALVAVALIGLLSACASQTPGPDDMQLGKNGRSGFGRDGGTATPGSARDFSQNVGDIVYFSTDSTDLTPEAQQTLAGQARWLQKYAQFTITIEGHADERGTREYNIGLGAKRAEAVKAFLSRNGVSPGRIRTISYGKERPVAVCNDISCWSQNRRAQTILNSRANT
jgi:peptidoglycan-associated lipoprotein